MLLVEAWDFFFPLCPWDVPGSVPPTSRQSHPACAAPFAGLAMGMWLAEAVIDPRWTWASLWCGWSTSVMHSHARPRTGLNCERFQYLSENIAPFCSHCPGDTSVMLVAAGCATVLPVLLVCTLMTSHLFHQQPQGMGNKTQANEKGVKRMKNQNYLFFLPLFFFPWVTKSIGKWV